MNNALRLMVGEKMALSFQIYIIVNEEEELLDIIQNLDEHQNEIQKLWENAR